MTPLPADPRTASEAGSTRTVDRALDLLDAVVAGSGGGGSRAGASPGGTSPGGTSPGGTSPGGTSLSELARAAELSPATASRLLGTLLKRGLVRRDAQGLFRPGLGLMQMGASVLRGEPLYELAGGPLLELAAASGETANLGVAVDDDRALYLRQVAGDQRVQTATWTGRTIPRQGTAMGSALAGRVGPGGYAVSRGSLEPDITSVAVPVRDYHGAVIAALSILAPSYRTDEPAVDRHGRMLVEHAQALSLALGA